ncbi:MAG: hypothetical protein HY046_03595 [Acidobacteria bacterium]|nr:hypothetical protein [Acidobacteriota bacterium]
MKKNIWRAVALILISAAYAGTAASQKPSSAPAADPFLALQFLAGEWTGEGGGAEGPGSGMYSFRREVGGKTLVRRNEAHYPAAACRPAIDHEDLMVIYTEGEGQPLKAIYFDTEGHVIRYAVSSDGRTATFLSEVSAPGPRYRLTYKKVDANRVAGMFEVAPPGKPEAFTKYLEWTAQRTGKK